MPEIQSITRRNGVAGAFAYIVNVIHPDEPRQRVVFHGSAFGAPGPVVMETAGMGQVFVTDPSRFGPKLDRDWVRRFFA